MNLSALARSMALGQPGSSGQLKVEKPHPKICVLRDYAEKCSIIRFEHNNEVFIYISNDFKIDLVFGDYRLSTKTNDFIRTLKQTAGEMILGGTHVTIEDHSHGPWVSWHGETSWMSMARVFGALMGVDAVPYIQSEAMSDEDTRIRLISAYPSRLLLRDPSGEVIVASPLESCGCCKALTRPAALNTRSITMMQDGVPLVLADGSPDQKDLRVCSKCEPKAINRHSRGDHEKPIAIEGYSRWPFERKVGIELEALAIAPLPDLSDLKWRIVNDSSITGFNFKGEPVEFNTPPAEGDAFYSRALAGIRRVQPFVRVNKSCGFHVHIDVQDMYRDNAKLANVQNLLIAFQPLMFAVQPPSRRASTYCRQWNDYTLIPAADPYISSEKYMAISFQHIRPPERNMRGEIIGGGYGTIEFRMGAGTRNPRKVLLFVQFLQRLIEIGSRVKDENSWMSLRDKTPWALLDTFKELAMAHDEAVERNPEFLRDLLTWMDARMDKFSPKAPLSVKAFTFNFDKKFEASEFSAVEDLDERFEEGQGIA